MSNTILRQWATRQQINQVRAMLRTIYMEGEEAADLIDEVNHSLSQSSHKRIGSSDLEAVADQIRHDCEAFNAHEIELHTQQRRTA